MAWFQFFKWLCFSLPVGCFEVMISSANITFWLRITTPSLCVFISSDWHILSKSRSTEPSVTPNPELYFWCPQDTCCTDLLLRCRLGTHDDYIIVVGHFHLIKEKSVSALQCTYFANLLATSYRYVFLWLCDSPTLIAHTPHLYSPFVFTFVKTSALRDQCCLNMAKFRLY